MRMEFWWICATKVAGDKNWHPRELGAHVVLVSAGTRMNSKDGNHIIFHRKQDPPPAVDSGRVHT